MDQHNIEMIKAALPYMNSRAQKSFEILVKTDELRNTIQNLDSKELSACDVKPNSIDMETFLLQMRSLSNKRESEMIDSMLHFIKMQKLLTAYRSFMNNKPENADNLMEFFLSQMAPEQKANFENINMMFNAMNN
ncbi:hypothetical protein [Acetivibrio ethanolgignens]|uniref:Uncharacterized protein n=1 Tax=Acetivibrio ethanolgignens TaxID=290052 RepID=A0A0V8QHH2_9FIRM|nr:hypothetical protein [Acetivibrio ethanolgignens]KSV59859.1 hypothetical protein ASU35_07605 [Acetivibrio ethanolgignens]